MILLAAALAASAPLPPPKLIVVISVDQLSSHLFEDYRPHFSRGLKRMSEGVIYSNGYQAHGLTLTCPGHATILTGAHPARHGIIANEWIDTNSPRADKRVYCAEDETVPGSSFTAYTVSPKHLRAATLGERMKAADPRSRSIAVSYKDRSATMLGGAGSERVWWVVGKGFQPSGGSSTQGAIDAVNAKVLAALAEPLPPLPIPAHCEARDRPVPVGGREVGRHRFARAAGDEEAFRHSPESDSATAALAARVIDDLALGKGPAPDLLAISFSATDAIGHRYGSGGVEMCLQLDALDRDLGIVFERLDASGVDYAVALTADHGGLDLPERTRPAGVADAERVDAGARPPAIGAEVARRLSLPTPVFLGDWHVSPAVPVERREEVLALAAELLEAHPQVAQVFRAELVAATPLATGQPEDWSVVERLRASYDPRLSGDLFVVMKPNVTTVANPVTSVATHGSVWDYDRVVPILFWRKGLAHSERSESAMTADIMPTLAAMIGVEVPADEIDGAPLAPVLGR